MMKYIAKRKVVTSIDGLPPKYNEKAVEQEIKKNPRIRGKEAKLIHALLKGRG
jgi:hypothetical protein